MITRSMSRRQQQQEEDKRSRAHIPYGIVAMRRRMKAEQALEEKEAALEAERQRNAQAALAAERQARKEAAEKEKQARKAQKASERQARKEAAEKEKQARKAQKAALAAEKKAERADSKASKGFYSFWYRAIDAKIRDHDEIARMNKAAEALIILSGVKV
jgi:hypothetical protein